MPAMFFAESGQLSAQTGIGGDSAGDSDFPDAGLFGGQGQFIEQDADDSFLYGSANVSEVVCNESRIFF